MYLAKKAELMSEKKSLEEQSSKLTLTANALLKPARQWLSQANSICKLAKSDYLLAQKELCQEIFGSNLILKSKNGAANGCPSCFSPQGHLGFAPQNQRKSRPHGRPILRKSISGAP